MELVQSGLKGNSLQDLDIGVLVSVNCVSALIEPGFMTNFTEAALMLDPDFVITVAESATRATCLNLDVPYIERNDVSAYKTVQAGDRGNAVKLLQFLLTSDGFDVAADGVFGAATKNALVDFQLLNGLEPDGIAGAATYRRLLTADETPALSEGSSGSHVTLLQRRLLSRLYPVTVDGIFGDETENALRLFQREHGLNDTGIAYPETLAALIASSPRPRLY